MQSVLRSWWTQLVWGAGAKGASAVVGAPGSRDEFMEKQLQILCVVIIIVYIVYYVTHREQLTV